MVKKEGVYLKKLKLIVSIIIIVIASTSILQADIYTDKQTLIDTAIKNSSSLKTQANSLTNFKKDLSFLKLCLIYQGNLPLAHQRYYHLTRMEKNTPDEIKEIGYLQSIIFSTPSESEQLLSINDTKNMILDLEYAVYSTQNNIEMQKNYIYMNINELYNELWKLDTVVNNKSVEIKNMELNFKIANAKLSKGLISQNDCKRLDLNLKVQKVELEKLLRQKKITESKIKKYVNISQNETINISFDTAYSNIKLEDIQYYIDFAYSNKTDILNATRYYTITEQKYLEAKKYVSFTGTNIVDDYLLEMQNANLGLEELKINAYSQIDMLYKTVNNNLNKVEQAKQLYEYREGKNKESIKRYNLGQISEYQLAQSSKDYNESMNSYYNAQAEANLSYYRLIHACGKSLY